MQLDYPKCTCIHFQVPKNQQIIQSKKESDTKRLNPVYVTEK